MFIYQGFIFLLNSSAVEPKSRVTSAIIAIILALLIAWMWVAGMKSKLKSVRKEDMAQRYIEEGSMNVRVRDDRFLHKNVVATPKPQPQQQKRG